MLLSLVYIPTRSAARHSNVRTEVAGPIFIFSFTRISIQTYFVSPADAASDNRVVIFGLETNYLGGTCNIGDRDSTKWHDVRVPIDSNEQHQDLVSRSIFHYLARKCGAFFIYIFDKM